MTYSAVAIERIRILRRMLNVVATAAATGDRQGRFNGVLDCFVKTAKEEGPAAFYKGFLPNFARLGTWNVIMFLTLEQVGVGWCGVAQGHDIYLRKMTAR